jgi:uncharacterized protein
MKKNKATLTQPLSERELDWLKNFLDNLAQSFDDCMTMEAVDGLFCALIINPLMAKPAEWMKIVCGKKHEFKSEAELEKVLNLLVRHWNHSSVLIENHAETKKNDHYRPLLIENDESKPVSRLAEQWASGFQVGLEYCANDWQKFSEDEENRSLLKPFLALKQGHHPDKVDEPLTQTERAELVAMIPAAAHRLFHYWIEKAQTENTASKPKIGRNDPCPCGSGKKYKKCCEGQVSATTH